MVPGEGRKRGCGGGWGAVRPLPSAGWRWGLAALARAPLHPASEARGPPRAQAHLESFLLADLGCRGHALPVGPVPQPVFRLQERLRLGCVQSRRGWRWGCRKQEVGVRCSPGPSPGAGEMEGTGSEANL